MSADVDGTTTSADPNQGVPATCACGKPAAGYCAELGQPACKSCAAFVSAVRGPTAQVVDDQPRTLRAAPDIASIVEELDGRMQDAHRDSERAPTAGRITYHRGRAVAYADAIRLLTDGDGGSR